MLSIYQKVGIQRQNKMLIIDFRHTDDARIGQRHWNVTVFPEKLMQRIDMLVDPECQTKCAVRDESEQGVLRSGITREQIHRLGQHWFADEERCIKFVDAVRDPSVMLFRSIEKSDERSSVNDSGGHRGRSPRDAWDL